MRLAPTLLLLTFCTAVMLPGQALADAQECRQVDEAGIAALFERWNAALKTGEPAKVVDNYAERSVLLPTLSDTPRVSRAEKEDYFVHFLHNHPNGSIDFRFVEIGCNQAIDTGLYTFTFGDGTRVGARYTFVYRWTGSDWLITSHHSSALPER